MRSGRLRLPIALPLWFDLALDTAEIIYLPLSPILLYASVTLPEIHKDPADRIIIATAQYYDAWLVTRDENIEKYPNLHTIWNHKP